MKKIIRILLLLTILGLITLLVVNYKYPFRIPNSGPWSIGFGSATAFPDEIDVKKNPIYTPEKLRAFEGNTRFIADPFFLKVKDTFYIFFEHQLVSPKAEIGLMTSTDGVHYKYRGTVLKQPFHLSYPQVFRYKEDFYMVPESQQANNVLLYKSHNFPFDWRISDTLVKNIRLKDPSIYVSDTLNIMVASDEKLVMHMYEADSLFGPWKLHKNERVIAGSESRAGGRFFADSKGLLLPMQNCSNGYGYGLSLYRLTFKDGDYTIKREKPYFLRHHTDIPEFSAGMHQLDIQKIGENQYYYVYDGNNIVDDTKKWNIGGTVKMAYYDTKYWFMGLFQ